jgi:hypothetical protein
LRIISIFSRIEIWEFILPWYECRCCSHNPAPAIPCLKFWKWARGPAKVGPYSIPRVVRFPRFRHFPHFPLSPFAPFTESTWKHAVFPHFPTMLKAHGNKLSLKTFYTALLISFYSWRGKCRVAIAANVFSFSCVQFGDFSEIVRGVFIFCKRRSDSRVSWVSPQKRFVLLTTGFSVYCPRLRG